MLKDMQDKYPTNAAGDKAFAITMWKDWDGTSIENANLLTCLLYTSLNHPNDYLARIQGQVLDTVLKP